MASSSSSPPLEEIPFWLQEQCHRLATNDPTLTNLNLNIRRLSPPLLNYLARALVVPQHDDGDDNTNPSNTNLSTLNLTSSLGANNDVPTLWDALQSIVKHPTMSVLHLSHNRLDTLPVSLSASHLVELHLDHNALQHPPSELLSSLKSNPSLRVLQLNGNRLCDEFCFHLSSVLELNETLQRIGLRRNRITFLGVRSLEDVLSTSNRTVHTLDVSDNCTPLPKSRMHRRLELWCRANQLGRRFWHFPKPATTRIKRTKTSSTSSPTMAAAVWPKVLSHLSKNPDVLQLFLQSNPHVLVPIRDNSVTDEDYENDLRRKLPKH